MQQHIHARQVVSGAVHLLTIIMAHFFHFPRHAQQQRAGAARWVVNSFQASLSGGDNARQYGGDLLGSIKLARLFARTAGKLPDQIFVGITQNIAVRLFQLEIYGVKMNKHFGNQLVLGIFSASQLGAGQVQILKQLVEILLAVGAHGGLFDTGQDFLKIVQDEAACAFSALAIAAFGDFAEQFGWLQEIAQLLHGLFAHGLQNSIAFVGAVANFEIFNAIFRQNLVGINMHFLGQIFVEDEAQDIITKFIGIHFAAQCIGNVPKLPLEFLLLFVSQLFAPR